MAEQINGYVGLDLSKLYDQDSELPEIAQNGEIEKLKNLDYLKEVLKVGKPIVTEDFLKVEGYSVIKVIGQLTSVGGGLNIYLVNGNDMLEEIRITFVENAYTGISAYGVQLSAIA